MCRWGDGGMWLPSVPLSHGGMWGCSEVGELRHAGVPQARWADPSQARERREFVRAILKPPGVLVHRLKD